MIRITKFRIKHNGVYYFPGDIIKGLSLKEEKALLSANSGILEKVTEVQEQSTVQTATLQSDNKNKDKQKNKDNGTTDGPEENLSINFNPDEVIK